MALPNGPTIAMQAPTAQRVSPMSAQGNALGQPRATPWDA